MKLPHEPQGEGSVTLAASFLQYRRLSCNSYIAKCNRRRECNVVAAVHHDYKSFLSHLLSLIHWLPLISNMRIVYALGTRIQERGASMKETVRTIFCHLSVTFFALQKFCVYSRMVLQDPLIEFPKMHDDLTIVNFIPYSIKSAHFSVTSLSSR